MTTQPPRNVSRPQMTTPAPPATDAPSPPELVVGGGSNAQKALDAILGAREPALTGDAEADCIAAIAAIDQWLKDLPLRRALILHALHAQYFPLNKDVWLRVATAVGRAKGTVHGWAHAAELVEEM